MRHRGFSGIALCVWILAGCGSSILGSPDAGPASAVLELVVIGSGQIAASGQANCVSICRDAVAAGEPITLTALPASGATFLGWGGACSGTDSSCALAGAAAKVTAQFSDVEVPDAGVGLSIAPAQVDLAPGATQAVTATVSGVSNRAVHWTLLEGLRAGAISSTGVYSAPTAAGTFHIVATSVGDPGLSATAQVTIGAGLSTRSISGSVAPQGAGFTVSLSGGAVATTRTDAAGSFRFDGLFDGTYALRAGSDAAYCSPYVATVQIAGADVSQGFTATPRLCSPDGWCWQNPTPQGDSFNAVWGGAADDIWAVGFNGLVFHYDGESWSQTSIADQDNFLALTGSSRTDVWLIALGDVRHFDGTSWTEENAAVVGPNTASSFVSAFSTGASDVWLAGNSGEALHGTVAHYDGSTWTLFDTGNADRLQAIWASGPDDAWTGDNQGRLWHWSGGAWSVAATFPDAFTALWGSAPDDVWAAGFNAAGTEGALFHWNGSAWTQSDTTGYAVLWSLWGTASDDVWALGDSRYHWDGSRWTELPESDVQLNGAWGSGSSSIWAVGSAGKIESFDGARWNDFTRGSPAGVEAIWGTGAGDLWAVGWQNLHSDGADWAPLPAALPFSDIALFAVWGSSTDDVWGAGYVGTIVHWVDGAPASSTFPGVVYLFAIWGAAADDVWMAGRDGVLLHWIGERFDASSGGVFTDLRGLWGSASNDIWAVGDAGVILHWDGTSWAPSPSGTTADLFSVWGSGPNDVWAVGTLFGQALHWDGATWTAVDVGASSDFYGVHGSGAGDVWMAGNSIVHFDGAAWTTESAPVGSGPFRAIWTAGGGSVWVVADGGEIIHRSPR